MTPAPTQNLNARRPRRSAPRRPAARLAPRSGPSVIRSSAPPVRIAGSASRYRRGYLVNV
jgi:hypothetical protein